MQKIVLSCNPILLDLPIFTVLANKIQQNTTKYKKIQFFPKNSKKIQNIANFCTIFTPYLHGIYTLFIRHLHSIYMVFTPYLHCIYTLFTLYLHTVYTVFTPYLAPVNTLFTPCLYPVGALFTPCLHRICKQIFANTV